MYLFVSSFEQILIYTHNNKTICVVLTENMLQGMWFTYNSSSHGVRKKVRCPKGTFLLVCKLTYQVQKMSLLNSTFFALLG